MGAEVVNNNVQVSGFRKWVNSGFYGHMNPRRRMGDGKEVGMKMMGSSEQRFEESERHSSGDSWRMWGEELRPRGKIWTGDVHEGRNSLK